MMVKKSKEENNKLRETLKVMQDKLYGKENDSILNSQYGSVQKINIPAL
jgi:hypothetical protein